MIVSGSVIFVSEETILFLIFEYFNNLLSLTQFYLIYKHRDCSTDYSNNFYYIFFLG